MAFSVFLVTGKMAFSLAQPGLVLKLKSHFGLYYPLELKLVEVYLVFESLIGQKANG